MHIDTSTFFILVGTIAASGAGGWIVRDKLTLRSQPPPPLPSVSQEPPAEPPRASAEPIAKPPPALPSCDDSSGEVPTCPVLPGPADEGGCEQMVAARCAQYRAAFKPKLARAAIECLKRLRGGQLCDPIAINKCGHEALMAACPPESEVLSDAGAPASGLDATCATILTACKASIPGPTLTDCKQTLSGMNDSGRTKMVACMQKLCDSRGLYGCEAR